MVIEKNASLGLYLKKAFETIGLLPRKIVEAGLFDGGYGILFTDEMRDWRNYASGQNIRKDESLRHLDDFIQKEIRGQSRLACLFEDSSFDIHDKNVWENQKSIFFVDGRKMHYFDRHVNDSFSGVAMDSESDTMLYGICSSLQESPNFSDVIKGLKPKKNDSIVDDFIKAPFFIVTSIFDGECYVIWVPKSSPFTLKF